jgi:hypothetical protein
MIKYQIEALFFNEGWECPEDMPTLYDTKAEAEAELKDHLESMADAVEQGFLTDYDAHDWRVAKVAVDDDENS